MADFSWYNPAASTVAAPMGIQSMPTIADLNFQPRGISGIDGGGSGGFFGGMDLSEGIGLGLQGANSLANLWMAFEANKLAKKQFGLTKKVTETNMANQISSFNTALEDRINSRAHTEGRGTGYAQDYLSKHKLREMP